MRWRFWGKDGREGVPLYSGDTLKILHETEPCAHCGGVHAVSCPRVKRLRFGGSGEIEEVEFWATWDESRVLYKEDLPPLSSVDGGFEGE